MFVKLTARSLTRSTAHWLLALTVALGAALTTAITTLVAGSAEQVSQQLKVYGSNITIRPQQAAALDELYGTTGSATLSLAALPQIKTIFWAYNILDFSPFLETTAQVDGQEVRVVGVWFDETLTTPAGEELTTGVHPLRQWWEVDGEWASGSAAMLGQNLAATLGLPVGANLRMAGMPEIPISGVFDSGGEFDDAVLLPISLAGQLAGDADAANWVEVMALTTPDNELARRAAADPQALSAKDWETWYCTAYVSSIAYQIEEVWDGVVARPVRQVAQAEGEVISRITQLLLGVAGLTLLATAIAIANLVTKSVLERSAELGLLKALGASNLAVLALVEVETLLVAVVGVGAGMVAGVGLAQWVGWQAFGSAVAAPAAVLALLVALLLLAVLLGTWPAGRLLWRLKPQEVLHGA